jgi:hypothetical protein
MPWLHQMGYSFLRLLTTPVVNVVTAIVPLSAEW